eukprot:2564534-Pyramimonas_sp.AAC.1
MQTDRTPFCTCTAHEHDDPRRIRRGAWHMARHRHSRAVGKSMACAAFGSRFQHTRSKHSLAPVRQST